MGKASLMTPRKGAIKMKAEGYWLQWMPKVTHNFYWLQWIYWALHLLIIVNPLLAPCEMTPLFFRWKTGYVTLPVASCQSVQLSTLLSTGFTCRATHRPELMMHPSLVTDYSESFADYSESFSLAILQLPTGMNLCSRHALKSAYWPGPPAYG